MSTITVSLKNENLTDDGKERSALSGGWILGEGRAPGRVAWWELRADRGSPVPRSLLRPQASRPQGSR